MGGLKIFTDAASLKRPASPSSMSDIAVGDPELLDEAFSDVDSLFDEPTAIDDAALGLGYVRSNLASYVEPPRPTELRPARRVAPPIPGLYFDPYTLLPDELAETLMQKCIDAYFRNEHVDQVMLFERVITQSITGEGEHQNFRPH